MPHWATLDRALDRALDLDGDERQAFLDALDPALRDALGPLLRDALRDDPILDRPNALLGVVRDLEDDARLLSGTRVGAYEIDALVGEGGMGRVFRARRADGVFEQTVAVKIVRTSLALAGTDVAARLRRERAVLAALDHPGIARLIDGGTTDDGVPYLVTEFVEGTPITAWADAHALDVPARLRLLVDVAHAVAHAHRRLVVHRDLKPSNVLVAERDGAARPVVLDFGIAKLLGDAADAEAALGAPLTYAGVQLFTPAYAAPELYDPAGTATTATDVYGLGALLYELLTGRRPHEGATLTAAPTTEVVRPSEAVRRVAETVAFDPAQRAQALAGDLDTICLKALHRDPSRRYASALALAEDVEAHLGGHPVSARPDSFSYVAGRFVRRNWVAVFAASVALLALVVGLGVTLVSLASERHARTAAETSQRHAAEAAELLAGLFEAAQPRAGAPPVTVRQALDEGVRKVQAIRSDALRAYLLGKMGMMYATLDAPARADSLLAASLALYGDASDTTVSKVRLNYASTRDAFGDHAAALALAQRVYDDEKASGHTSPLAVRALLMLARQHLNQGHLEEGTGYAERAVGLARAPSARTVLPRALESYGHALLAGGHIEEAIRTQREAVRLSLTLYGPDDYGMVGAWGSLAGALMAAQRFAEAETYLRKVQALQSREVGPGVGLSYTLAGLAATRLARHDAPAAADLLDSALMVGRPVMPAHHWAVPAWAIQLADASNEAKQYRRAEQAAREAARRCTAAGVPLDHTMWASIWSQHGLALYGQGRTREARPLLERAQRALAKHHFPPEDERAAMERASVRAALAAFGP